MWAIRRKLSANQGDQLNYLNYSDPVSFVSAGPTCLTGLPNTSKLGFGFEFTAGAGLSGFTFSADGQHFTPIAAMGRSRPATT